MLKTALRNLRYGRFRYGLVRVRNGRVRYGLLYHTSFPVLVSASYRTVPIPYCSSTLLYCTWPVPYCIVLDRTVPQAVPYSNMLCHTRLYLTVLDCTVLNSAVLVINRTWRNLSVTYPFQVRYARVRYGYGYGRI